MNSCTVHSSRQVSSKSADTRRYLLYYSGRGEGEGEETLLTLCIEELARCAPRRRKFRCRLCKKRSGKLRRAAYARLPSDKQ